jgi:hypothetical protein
MRHAAALFLLLFVVAIYAPVRLHAQVTTATLIGLVRDSSGAIVPGATVVATNEGTGVPRESVSDSGGEFVLTALPNGTYSIKIDLVGFKTHLSKGLALGSGQTVRQTFALELGTVAETVTVAGEAPLIETSSSSQAAVLGSQEVRELPMSRRNITNLLSLAPGVTTNSTGMVQMNGVAGGGTGVTVDGTEANSSPEARSMSQYGAQNQISIMSIDAVQEVQIIKGVLPAEYGGVVGGQVNMISRSGTNTFRGSAFENSQNQIFNARSFFSTTPKPKNNFHQYGGTLGGPVIRNKAFFFTTYEGYHETTGVNITGNVPYPALRDQLVAVLPFPETKILIDTLPQATEPVVNAQGVVNTNVGRWRGVGIRKRTENHFVEKGDVALFNGSNLAVTYTRLRPWTLEPRLNVNGSNDRVFPNQQDRIASQFVMTHGRWVSESRFGWNYTHLSRLDAFFNVKDPAHSDEVAAFGRRIGYINISGQFAGPSSEIFYLTGNTWSFDQKFSRDIDRHLIKAGFHWAREAGNKLTAQNPEFDYQTLPDTLANIPQQIIVSFGTPYYYSHLDEFGGFIQDDWRVGSALVFNLGLRYDYYATYSVHPTTTVPAEMVNLQPASDLRKLDFGAFRDPQHPYDADGINFGPRAGFVWTLGGSGGKTVVRGGIGDLHSPHLPATVRQITGDPYVSFRTIWNRTQVAARGLTWPNYNDPFRQIVIAEGAGKKSIFSVINPTLSTPYTLQSMVSVERQFGRSMGMEIGYVHTDGRSFPLQRQFTLAIDRTTGVLPNAALLGAPGGYYVDSGQTMTYNALQTSLRKRFSNHYSYEVAYALGKGLATQGGDIAAYYIASIGNTQDFWNPESDRGPTDNDIRHRLNTTLIYELPGLQGGKGVLNGILGGWQLSGIFTALSGGALTVTQPSGATNSRPDIVPGVDPVLANWQNTCTATGCTYLNTAAFALVPVSPVTNATLRPGTYQVGQVRGPASFVLNSTIAKNFPLGTQKRLQVRADIFNALNQKNYSNPTSATNSVDFGRITSAAAARTMQVGARLSF